MYRHWKSNSCLIGTSGKVNVPGLPVDLDRGIVSELAWQLLDWGLYQLRERHPEGWDSKANVVQYNKLRAYALDNYRDEGWNRFLGEAIQKIATEGMDKGLQYARRKCLLMTITLGGCEDAIGELEKMGGQELVVTEKKGGDRGVSSIEKSINNLEGPVDGPPQEEGRIVRLIRDKVEPIQEIVRLLDLLKEKLETVSALTN
jgi:hypothetical protein